MKPMRNLRRLSPRCAATTAAALALTTGFAASQLTAASSDQSNWPSYNRTLTSERYSSLDAINPTNVARLAAICTFDTGQETGFQTGLVEVDGALFFTTEQDTFSVDPNTCQKNWQVHENTPLSTLRVNRGVAVMGGRVFRGTSDGRVIAYDERTGRQQWATSIADPAKGETVPAAPIAWNGMVFIGNAGGDNKGVKGRMYALDASNGNIMWEFYLVPKSPDDVTRGPQANSVPESLAASWMNANGFPITGGATWTSYTLDPATGLLYVPGGNPAPDFVKDYRAGDNLFTGSIVVLDARTGAYRRHFQLVRRDFHDWDVSTAPTLFTSSSGVRMMAAAPKDGHLYGFDLDSNRQLYRMPVTTISNAEEPLTQAGTRFCPGSQGGAEWNGPVYDPMHHTVLTGEVDWCTTVRTDPKETIQNVSLGQPWSGSQDGFGKQDDPSGWAGWLTASDAATGAKKWQFKAPYPLMGGITPTAGGVVFFGDMGGNFYAFDSSNGTQLFSTKLPGAIGGGVITYDTGAGQRVAIASGMTSPIWPTPKVTAHVVVLGLR